jgi:hypothetical protein
MEKLENKIWEIAEMGQAVVTTLMILGIVLLVFWGHILAIKIIAIVLLVYSIGETGRKGGYRKGLEEGNKLKE